MTILSSMKKMLICPCGEAREKKYCQKRGRTGFRPCRRWGTVKGLEKK